MEVSKRLFISNVPENVTNSELEEKFGKHGKVTSVKINQRKNTSGNQLFFAYINLDINNVNLQKCIEECANKMWKSIYLDVQLAKESFLDRLKRERELESSKGSNVESPGTSENKNKKFTLNTSNTFLEDVVVEQIKTNKSKKIKHDSKPESPNSIINGNDGDLVVKNNKFKALSKKINVNLFQNDKVIIPCVDKPEKSEKTKIVTEADRKRIQSLADMRKEFKQQKFQIKMALANLDAKPKNKIIFDDDNLFEKRVENKRKKALFEDSDEDEESQINFEVKEQFQGEKGQKLLRLQSKFKNDKRFAMDAKFLEDEEDKQSNEKNEQKVKTNGEVTYKDEKEMQYGVLESVLGVQISKQPVNKELLSKIQKGMLRFDPNQPEHNVFEIKASKPEKVIRKKAKLVFDEKVATNDISEIPAVSKSKFYKVTEDLKEVFQKDTGSFSLLSSYQNDVSYPDSEVQDIQPQPTESSNLNLKKLDDLFKYDSSEEEENEVGNTEDGTEKDTQHTNNSEKRSLKPRVWSDPFFFTVDDYRLQDGLDFIRRLEIEDKSEFVKLRRNLKEIVKTKVRNTQRKNKLFKKKLGGRKKRIKMKKALNK